MLSLSAAAIALISSAEESVPGLSCQLYVEQARTILKTVGMVDITLHYIKCEVIEPAKTPNRKSEK
jgi:hypothetical protein